MKEREILSRRDFLKLTGVGFVSLFLKPELAGYTPYIQSGDNNSGKIAISIDDGWCQDKVEKMLDILDGTPATLFVVGTVLRRDSKTYLRALNEGHLILNHTWSHQHLNAPGVNVSDQILWWENAYEELGRGKFRNKAMRLPGNAGADKPSIYNSLYNLGYEAVFGWSGASNGVFRAPPTEIIAGLKPFLTSGSIFLFHFVDNDLKVMPDVIKMIKDCGLTPVRLDKLPGVPIYEAPRLPRRNKPEPK
jgi:hypothetical protein